MINGVHHIALRALDYEASLKFYTEALGMKVRTTWGSAGRRVALIDCGGSCIELFEGGVGEKTEPEMQAGEWYHLALRTDDVDGAFKAAIAAGAKPKIDPKDVQLGIDVVIPARIAFVYGLSNEVIEFFCEK